MIKKPFVLILIIAFAVYVGLHYHDLRIFLSDMVLRFGAVTTIFSLIAFLFTVQFLMLKFFNEPVISLKGIGDNSKVTKGIDKKMLVLGFLVGLLVMVPLFVVYIWLFLKFR
jgi:hypothetical protein